MGFSLGGVVKGVALGGVGGGLAGALMGGGGSSGSGVNIQPQLNEINSSAKTQNGLVNDAFAKRQALNQPFVNTTHQTGVNYQDESRAASDKFLNDIGQSSDKLGENLSQALTRRTLAAVPQQQQQLRESLAATGGLQRGGADQAFMQHGQQTASDLFEGNQNIVNQQLQARQDAMKQAYSIDEGLIRDRLGIDQDALAKVYSSGNQQLIDQANALLGIEQNKSAQTLGAEGFQTSAQMAQDMANKQQQNALLSSLLSVAGTVGGAVVGGPAGAMVGNKLGSAVAPTLSTSRGTVNPVA